VSFRSFPVSRTRVRAIQALAAIAGIVLLALLVDGRVHAWYPTWKDFVLDGVVGAINPIGTGVTLLVLCAALSASAGIDRRSALHRAASIAMSAFVTAGLITFALKHAVARVRPDHGSDVDSFPSGHATSVFTVATVFAHFFPRLTVPLYGLASAIALGRVYLDRHYVSDIVAGALIGWIVATLLLRALERYQAMLPRWAAPSLRPDPSPRSRVMAARDDQDSRSRSSSTSVDDIVRAARTAAPSAPVTRAT
jgi:membrane-associated phospholipid phosphatase